LGKRWSDHYTRKAKAAGYGARSVWKLEEIQRRTQVIPHGGRALDLGCYPGSWSRYLLQQGIAQLVGVDLKLPKGLKGRFLEVDALEADAEMLRQALGGPADLVVSDMAPATTGNRFSDHLRQLELAYRTLELAEALLKPGGGLVVKVFEGPDAPDFVQRARGSFGRLRRVKPTATRKQSVEFFAVGLGFRG